MLNKDNISEELSCRILNAPICDTKCENNVNGGTIVVHILGNNKRFKVIISFPF